MSATPPTVSTAPGLDPDRFFDFREPGSQEWWYFDAISDDGRDALIVIFFAGLPIDPSYSAAAKRHLKDPKTFPAPHPLDHCGVSVAWYRTQGASLRRRGRGKPGLRAQAYALNAHRRQDFSHEANPFRLAIAGSSVARDAEGYRIAVDVPDWDPSRRISADLHVRAAAGTEPLEVDLGGEGSSRRWLLAAADCRVAGTIGIDGPGGETIGFQGRGYHDHDAGAEELSLAIRRREWGRVHEGDRTEVYYVIEPRNGPRRSFWVSCRDGKPEQVREDLVIVGRQPWSNAFFIPYDGDLSLTASDGQQLRRWNDHHIDSGPIDQRWMAEFRAPGFRSNRGGLSDLLDTRLLNRPMVNWMVPDRRLRRSPR